MLHNQGDFGEGVEKNAVLEYHKRDVELKKPDTILQSPRRDECTQWWPGWPLSVTAPTGGA